MRSMKSLVLGLAAIGLLAGCQKAANTVTSDDMSMGAPNAKVTIIEYASVACPHCGAFNNEVFPAFKAKYIDTGKVRWVEREALTGDPAIAAAGFLTARCAGKDKYFTVVDAIYHAQDQMEQGGDPHAILLNIARSAGLTEPQFDKCITDEKAINALQARWDHYVNVDKITGTPTFVVNGKTYASGALTLPQLEAAVAEAQGGQKSAS
jgi:protein-disulfide isomerase